MFNGGPHEQFHQFMASTAALPLPLPVTLPFHVPPNSNFSSDIHQHEQLQPNSYHHHHQLFPSQLLHRPSAGEVDDGKDKERGGNGGGGGGGLELEGVPGSVVSPGDEEMVDPWSKEEVFALLAIRSTLGNDEFSDFIWGHVSRKLAELGFKRSAEKCKEKIEEVIKYNTTTSYGNNYCLRSFNELDALFEDPNHKSLNDQSTLRSSIEAKMSLNLEESSGNETLENPVVEDHQQVVKKPRRSKKRKRNHKLELLMGFSEFVSKVMIQQEQLHKRLLEDMERREEERIAREESWRKKEMDRLNKEIEIRAREQAIASDREATIIEFLKKFTSSSTTTPSQSPSLLLQNDRDKMIIKTAPESEKAQDSPISSTSLQRNPNPSISTPSKTVQPTIKNSNSAPIVPNTQKNNISITNTNSSPQTLKTPKNPSCELNTSEREDHGKRWPRDEVNSLIKLRCSLSNTEKEDKGLSTNKAPLWERISQGMLELGYKRSAKKCKEKWENINKYFRKAKDTNKKRSADSKTCPYFHQLSSLYNIQGRQGPDRNSSSENFLETSESHQIVQRSSVVGFDEAIARVDDDDGRDDHGEKSTAQVSPLEFEY